MNRAQWEVLQAQLRFIFAASVQNLDQDTAEEYLAAFDKISKNQDLGLDNE